jgi:hypothetical protein
LIHIKLTKIFRQINEENLNFERIYEEKINYLKKIEDKISENFEKESRVKL